METLQNVLDMITEIFAIIVNFVKEIIAIVKPEGDTENA